MTDKLVTFGKGIYISVSAVRGGGVELTGEEIGLVGAPFKRRALTSANLQAARGSGLCVTNGTKRTMV